MNKHLLPYDIYERHRRVAEFIDKDDTVLDVGGELNHLAQFTKPKKILVANLNTGDVIIKKNNLPFSQNSFDIVCAIDVLEHIPRNERKPFIIRLLGIAKKGVILSFPVGTSHHVSYEKKMQKYLENKKIDVTYLKEHIRYGLPQNDEIKKDLKGLQMDYSFSGNITLNEYLFKVFIFDPKIKFLRRIIYYLKLLLNLITNPILYNILSKKSYSEDVNREYLVIFK